ncbi:hypothetical protein BKP45_12400 [Anaerobacillus alkalidiazotrophicus]|uniref:Prepilin-type N-terminal cleavage/methylation domain-containing protein n=1 Tax=Anaerobacillus alkalidiazotrophicus TaxID=472963 RepID=A0A1S2M537_9BACI|nr:type II secretion system protein [Anaerobacillus alkalidiazotrophicus]OIJ18370.1 hypothetical protein BKP45_18115 [Anaerobacillus alkalidiazotrophicus]OIJ19849.1 hypothetical protein BKP45_12400 [Anaerobacillus alkalidiazotrophicus]
MRKLLKNQKGLTLIELLAVIVILGIIAAIAVPSIGGIISKTEDKAIVAEAIQIINAAKLDRAANGAAMKWTHTGKDNSRKLEEYLEKVDQNNTNYTVTRNGVEFSISGHPAVQKIGGTVDGSVTEKELNDFARDGKKKESDPDPND